MRKDGKGMDIVTKMALIGGAGLIVIIFLVIILSIAMKSNTGDKNTVNPTITPAPTEEVEENQGVMVKALAVIKKVDTKSNQLTILNIESKKNIVLKIDGAVDIKDEYGTLLTLAQLSMGDMIETKYDESSMRPDSIHISGQIWERKNVSNMQIDKEKMTIQIGNDSFSFTNDLVTSFLGISFDITSLDPVDEVIVKGYKDIAWSIEVVKTHGFIKFLNYKKYLGGTIEIDKKTIPIQEDLIVTVAIGVHNVVISKDGVVPYSTQVLVEENQEVVIDLADVQFEAGMVSFNLTPADVKLYINDELYMTTSEPISLDFGTYNIRLEKTGYDTRETELVVDQAFMTIEYNMDAKAKYLHVDNPTDRMLYVDGNYIGIIPIETPITPGAHTLTISQEGYYTKTYVIQIDDDGNDSFLTFQDLVQMTTTTPSPEPTPTIEPTPEPTPTPEPSILP